MLSVIKYNLMERYLLISNLRSEKKYLGKYLCGLFIYFL